MIRFLFTSVITVLVGLGAGYFLWGTRVARLTESLSGLTLELDTMRARVAAGPSPEQVQAAGTNTAGELRVINESLAAVRQDLADQKVLLEKAAAGTDTTGPNVAACEANLRGVRGQLALCEADRKDLEARLGVAPSYRDPGYAPQAPSFAPPAPATPGYQAPSATPPSPGAGTTAPRYAQPSYEEPSSPPAEAPDPRFN